MSLRDKASRRPRVSIRVKPAQPREQLRMVDRESKTHSSPWAKSIPTFVSAARIWGAFRFMAKCELHGTIPQLLALGWCELVQPRTVPLHDQGAGRLLCRRFLERFHTWFILLGRASVKPVTQNRPFPRAGAHLVSATLRCRGGTPPSGRSGVGMGRDTEHSNISRMPKALPPKGGVLGPWWH